MANLNEIEVLKIVSDALLSLDDEARHRILGWMNSKYSFNVPTAEKRKEAYAPESSNTVRASKKGAVKNSGKKGKLILKQIKELNLNPKGKKSAIEFVALKQPSNHIQKTVAAVYYLTQILDLESVTTEHVYTMFKYVGWPLPTNLPNTLQQAGSKGWLDTSDSTNLKITPSGENLVEHNLPVKV